MATLGAGRGTSYPAFPGQTRRQRRQERRALRRIMQQGSSSTDYAGAIVDIQRQLEGYRHQREQDATP